MPQYFQELMRVVTANGKKLLIGDKPFYNIGQYIDRYKVRQ